VARGDLNFALPRVADNRGNSYVRFPQSVITSLSEKDRKEFAAEFRDIEPVLRSFDSILYSNRKTDVKEVNLKPADKGALERAKLHRIAVKILGAASDAVSEVLFLEAPSGLYWVPFGW
jgi:hypothetical protein